MATQGNTQDPKTKIQALLDIRKLRGLEGRAAIDSWLVASMETLLEAELARIEKRELDRT